jgi:methyl-accepting chemotaxis protein
MIRLRVSLYRKIIGLACFILLCCGVIILLSNSQRNALNERGTMRLAKIYFLEARQAEREFTAQRDTVLVGKLEYNIRALLTIFSIQSDTAIQSLLVPTRQYLGTARKLAHNVQERGLTENLGIEGRFRMQVHAVEDAVKASAQLTLLVDMYLARRHEKDFINRGANKYVQNVRETVQQFFIDVDKTTLPEEERIKLRTQMQLYRDGFENYVRITREINANRATLDTIANRLTPRIEAVVQERERTAERYELSTNIAILTAFVVAIVIALLLAQRIARPVELLTNAANSVASGANNVHVEMNTGDEFESLANSFNTMITNLKASLEEIGNKNDEVQASADEASVARDIIQATQEHLARSIQTMLFSMQAFAMGDLTVNLPMDRDDAINKLFRGFNGVVQDMSELVGEVVAASHAIANASNRITTSTEEIAHSMRTQRQRTSEIAAAIEEISSTMAENMRQSSHIAGEAAEASIIATSGGQAMRAMVRNVEQVATVVLESSNTIERLGASSENIGAIVSTIEEIADQTNLLALNAAIEAARAGDQGRGFAVVADEVRKLAERTQTATREITQMITDIHESTSNAVESMQRATSLVQQSSGLASETERALQDIIRTTGSVAEFVSLLADAGREQATTSNSIAESISTINTLTEQSSTKTYNIAASAEELEHLTEKLAVIVSRFLLVE